MSTIGTAVRIAGAEYASSSVYDYTSGSIDYLHERPQLGQQLPRLRRALVLALGRLKHRRRELSVENAPHLPD